MKNLLKVVFAATIAAFFAACGGGSSSSANSANSADSDKLVIGATPEPHAIMLNQIKPELQKAGIKLEVREFTDYVTPNKALDDGSILVNFFQHAPYLNSFNAEHKTQLVSIAGIHIEPMGVYSKKLKSLDELKDGDLISIPNDPSNGSRALRVLEKQGLIALKTGVKLPSVQDIAENKKGLKFKEMDAPQLARALGDVSASVINTNFALLAGLNPLKDAIAIEDKDSPYANILAVKKGNENDPRVQALKNALMSEDVKKFILDKYKGAILPAF